MLCCAWHETRDLLTCRVQGVHVVACNPPLQVSYEIWQMNAVKSLPTNVNIAFWKLCEGSHLQYTHCDGNNDKKFSVASVSVRVPGTTGSGGRASNYNRPQWNFWVLIVMVYIVIAVIVIQQYAFVGTHQIAVLNLVDFILCKLHLCTADKKRFLNIKKTFARILILSALASTNWGNKIPWKFYERKTSSILFCLRNGRINRSYKNSSVSWNQI